MPKNTAHMILVYYVTHKEYKIYFKLFYFIGIITERYKEIFPEPDDSITIGQDLFHARERIVKTLRRNSKQFAEARGELCGIMAAFKKTPENGNENNPSCTYYIYMYICIYICILL